MANILIQHSLPIIPEAPDVEYDRPTRLFIIDVYGSAGSDELLTDLQIRMSSVELSGISKTGPDDKYYVEGGEPAKEPEPLIEKITGHGIAPIRNPLDFSVDRACRMIFMIRSEFLKFSETLEPITLKQECSGRYRNIKLLDINDDGIAFKAAARESCRLISIATTGPVDGAYGVKHGFSLNLDLGWKEGTTGYSLPITLDPDIENKGRPGSN